MKRLLTFTCALSMAMLMWPSDAAAQRGGGGHRGGSGGGGQPATARPPGGGHDGGHGGGPGRGGGYPSGGYRPYYGGGYRGGYYGYRPYYYSPYWYNGFYASFYYGLGFAPYYASYYGYGYPWGYYGAYGYPGPYPYPAYAYGAWSSARIEVKPRDAQVYVDGYFVGVVDQFDGVFQRLDLPAGEHELAIYMPGYQTYRERTLFRPGQSYHYKDALQPLPPGAPPEPKPQPSPNTQQNGQPNGPPNGPPNENPYSGGAYPEGPYRQPPPPPDRGEPGPPQPGRGYPRANNGGFGTLNLRVQPADAIVQIDGERWDSAEGGSRLVVQLAAGPHRVEVRKDGFRSYSGTIDIRPGEPQTLNVVLPQQD